MWLILAFDYHALLHYVPMLMIASVVALLVHLHHRGVGFRFAALDTVGRRGASLSKYRNSSSW